MTRPALRHSNNFGADYSIITGIIQANAIAALCDAHWEDIKKIYSEMAPSDALTRDVQTTEEQARAEVKHCEMLKSRLRRFREPFLHLDVTIDAARGHWITPTCHAARSCRAAAKSSVRCPISG